MTIHASQLHQAVEACPRVVYAQLHGNYRADLELYRVSRSGGQHLSLAKVVHLRHQADFRDPRRPLAFVLFFLFWSHTQSVLAPGERQDTELLKAQILRDLDQVIGVSPVVLRAESQVRYQIAEKPQLLLLVLPLSGQQYALENLFGAGTIVRGIVKETVLPRMFPRVQVVTVLLPEIPDYGAYPFLFSLSQKSVREIKRRILKHY